ncbi:hypothetical protein DPEC_G00125580 [Dallia pectoralis]|uniref:Uncharacterized protein n=1 Tax=Dallia pectoralis TaxID=75939 RepID=A0ACC2GRA9_DALPE|nr:hypothetical protein DPEC_G00125580 [Dallia pectoralis]
MFPQEFIISFAESRKISLATMHCYNSMKCLENIIRTQRFLQKTDIPVEFSDLQ